MGAKLQIRVSAETYRPEDILEDWPGLAELAWGGELAVPGGPKRGVLDLVQDLWDKLRFDAPDDVRRDMSPGVQRALDQKRDLEAALADWKPAEAARLALALEATLDELEPLAPKPPFVVSRPKH